jgi:lyso-ornithine lipid O-acyltransferase
VAPVSFIARHDVNAWPFFGSLARLQRTVFVNRNRRHTTGASRDEMRERLAAGDMLVLFAEGTSGDGTRVLPFKSTFFAAAENSSVAVQPLSVVYTGHRNLPMPRHLRPLYAWYGDMEMPPHLWAAMAHGPIEVKIICHAAALHGRSWQPENPGQTGGRGGAARAGGYASRAGQNGLAHGP